MARIGLVDVDSKIPNLALMKLSSWHKAQGDDVFHFTPIEHAIEPFDIVYASKVFTGSADNVYLPEGAILGGTGYGLNNALPEEIEHTCPDYELYGANYSMGFTSRGCVRKCGFCVVPEKEGKIHEHSPLSEFTRHRKVILMDNNFLASPMAAEKLIEIKEKKLRVDFNQGLDIRLMTKDFAKLLTNINPSILRFAWDDIKDEASVMRGLNMLKDAGYPFNTHKLSFYVLVNFNSSFEEDKYRIDLLHSHNIATFVMIYKKTHSTRMQRELCSWANFPWAWRRMPFETWLKIKKVNIENANNSMVMK